MRGKELVAERNVSAHKCNGGQNVNTMMKIGLINENEKESTVEEKGFVKKDNGGGRNLQGEGGEGTIMAVRGNDKKGDDVKMIIMDKENGEERKVEEEVGIENENTKGVKNKEEEDRKKYTCGPFDKVLEKWPRALIDLNDWPPYPWSLEYLEREMLRTWDSNPYWDIELMQGSWAYEDDEEIIWEDDVWHLKDIKEIPMKPFKKIRDSK